MPSTSEYLSSKNVEFREQSGQIVLKICPFCNDEKFHFYISPDTNGPFFCHKCQQKGNLFTLMKHFGDFQSRKSGNNFQDSIKSPFKKQTFKMPEPDQVEKYHEALLKNPGAIEYLSKRGINEESMGRFKLGFAQKSKTAWITIPHFRGGNLINVKFRSLPPAEKTFQRIPGCRSILFNGDALKDQTEAFICEGEFDLITLVQSGIENAVSGTTGAGSFDPNWIDELKHLKKIFIVYDADEKGQEGARSLAKRLGYNRCFNIVLPEGMDANDFFNTGHDVFDFQKLTHEAHRFDLPGVISTDTAIDLLIREKRENKGDTGLTTPWPSVNKLIRGFKPGDLIVLAAPPKTGKTSWALDICRELAIKDIPVLFYCLEMRPERLINKTLQAYYRREELSENDFKDAKRKLAGLPLYFGHAFKKQPLEAVIALLREAIQRYDLKFIVFDNLHFLIRSVSNVNEELGQAVQGFKLLAEEMEIPIMAIAQPRKRDTSAKDEIMSADDIKYSNAIHADCDQMIILHRKRVVSKASEIKSPTFQAKTESLDQVTLVRAEAHRYGSGGEALLFFHGEYSRFDEMEQGQQPQEHWSECYQ